MISAVEMNTHFENGRSLMQMTRRRDEVAYSHAMGANELKQHLERSIVPGDCSMCEWFGRFEKGNTEKI